MRIDAMEGLSTNPYFIRNGINNDIENEYNIIKALKMFKKQNQGAFKLIKLKYFKEYGDEYYILSVHAGTGNTIFPEMKSLIWKLNRLWEVRLCEKMGAVNLDWRVITVEYQKYLDGDIYNEIKEWEKLFESIKTNYTRAEMCKIIGCNIKAELFGSLDCIACHRLIKTEIESIAEMKVLREEVK